MPLFAGDMRPSTISGGTSQPGRPSMPPPHARQAHPGTTMSDYEEKETVMMKRLSSAGALVALGTGLVIATGALAPTTGGTAAVRAPAMSVGYPPPVRWDTWGTAPPTDGRGPTTACCSSGRRGARPDRR